MSHTSDEVDSQPAVWRETLRRQVELSRVLPPSGENIAAVGCGRSFYIAQAYARRREALGVGPGDAFSPAELPMTRRYDRLLVICRSGTTTEVVRLLAGPRVARAAVVITAMANSPVAAVADDYAADRPRHLSRSVILGAAAR